MCNNGVNFGQFETMLDMLDDHVKTDRRWAHNLAHLAEDAGMDVADESLHKAMKMLDEVRALISEAKDSLEDLGNNHGVATVTVELV